MAAGLCLGVFFGSIPGIPMTQVMAQTQVTQKFSSSYQKETASKYGYIQPASQSYAKNPTSKLKKSTALPSKYGTMSKAAKNQNPFGTCWAFAGVGLFEYAVDQEEGTNTNFSEEHLIDRLSKDGSTGYQITDKDTGGNEYMYSGYFTSGYGPVDGEKFPYLYNNQFLTLTQEVKNTTGKYRATDVQFFDTTINATTYALSLTTRNLVKQAVYENGCVTAGISWDNDYVQTDDKSFVCLLDDGRDYVNHEIELVGWDDSYSKENFEGVTEDGAWLIRNSWGSNLGDQGYYWVSYEDKSLTPSCTIANYEEVGSDDTIYNLDEFGALYPQVSCIGESKVGFINVFTLNKEEKLKEVTFYESETGAKYQLFAIPVHEDGTLDLSKKQALTEVKTNPYPGYHTEKIQDFIQTSGKIAIMVEVQSQYENASIGAEGSLSDGTADLYIPTLKKGESYTYINGQTNDIYGNNFGNWSIKLVTEKAEENVRTITDVTQPEDVTYTGKEIKRDLKVSYQGVELKEGTDYTISYENNVNVGTAKIVIQGIGNYTGTVTKTFQIYAKSMTLVEDVKDVTYTGSKITPEVVAKSDDTVLKEGTDYAVSYKNNENVGTATIQVTGTGNYTGNITKTFKILAKGITTVQTIQGTEYTGSEITPEVVVKSDNTILKKGIDYELTYENHKNAGVASVKVVGKGNYTGTIFATFGIWKKTITSVSNPSNQIYTGATFAPDLIVESNGKRLTKGVDYTITYKNHQNAGVASVTVQGIGNYTGTFTKQFAISKARITYVSNPSGAIYTGKNIYKNLDVKCGNRALRYGADYQVHYAYNKYCGRAKITVTGKGNYTGTYTRYFYIYPKKSSISKLKSGKKSAKVYVKKASGGVSGYQIRYSNYKSFKKSKYKTTKKTSYTVKGLKRKKYVYVKVRSYKTIGSKKIYGSWSSYKKIKVK